MITRRGLITGFAALLAAPAIVRASSLMPVSPWNPGDGVALWSVPYPPGPVAGEHLWAGDLLTLKSGRYVRAAPTDKIMGVSLTTCSPNVEVDIGFSDGAFEISAHALETVELDLHPQPRLRLLNRAVLDESDPVKLTELERLLWLRQQR